MRNLLMLLIVATGAANWTGVLGQTIPAGPRLAPEQFVILPWGETPGDSEALQAIYDCGFNLAGFVKTEYLDMVAAAQLKCIVIDPSQHACEPGSDQTEEAQIREHVQSLVGRVGGHPAVYGYYIVDEPSAEFYPQMKMWVEAYRRFAPQAVCYINLFGGHATPKQMGVATYEEYLESFVQTVQPSFLSYDRYSLMADGTVRDGWFQNLETVRAMALRYNLPFWNIVLGNAHYNYAEPTDAGLRFQLYTTLAHGAKGISYFTYFTPNIGNYRLGPIDQYGRKTRTWDMVRTVNTQLHRIGQVYTQLRSTGVFHHPIVPAGCMGIETSRLLAQVEGGNLMVGEFEGPEGQPYVMVVNKSLQESLELRIRFREEGVMQFVSPYTGQMTKWRPDNHWLAPGQGLLMTLTR